MLQQQSDINSIITEGLSLNCDACSICEHIASRIFNLFSLSMEKFGSDEDTRRNDFWTDTEIVVCRIHLQLPRESQKVLLSATEYLYVRSNPPCPVLSKLPFIMLENMLLTDTITESCETWKLLEKTVDFYRENCDKDVFSTIHVKLPILRISNALLRNLSKVQNPLYSGKILMLLNSLYPIWEVSGLSNLKFNPSNATSIESETDFSNNPSSMPLPIDYKDYKSFWGLQDCLKALLSNKSPPAAILVTISNILDLLVRVPSLGSSSLKQKLYRPSMKFLTSSNLLSLQLSDSSIRDQILIQIQIILNLLTSNYSQLLSTPQKLNLDVLYQKLSSLVTPELRDVMAVSCIEMEGMWRDWKADLQTNSGKKSYLVEAVLQVQGNDRDDDFNVDKVAKRKRDDENDDDRFHVSKVATRQRADDGKLEQVLDIDFSLPNVVPFSSSYSQCMSMNMEKSDMCHPAGDKVWNWRMERLFRNWDGNLLEMTIQGNLDLVVAALHPDVINSASSVAQSEEEIIGDAA